MSGKQKVKWRSVRWVVVVVFFLGGGGSWSEGSPVRLEKVIGVTFSPEMDGEISGFGAASVAWSAHTAVKHLDQMIKC